MRKVFLYTYLALLLLVPLVLAILPADHFDTGESVCLSVYFFDLPCYGCGMTRAIQHLIHFDFAVAWEYNKLSYIVLPLVGFLLGREVWRTCLKIKIKN